MRKGRKQSSATVWEESNKSAVYLDSAYKQLLRQDLQASALKNRTKVLNLNQDHILRQIQNNQEKLTRLESIRKEHSQDIRKMARNEERKTHMLEEQKEDNMRRKNLHQRQMITLSCQKKDHLSSVKREALEVRKENARLIEANRQRQIEKKREVRNKIHNDIVESRLTIQQFFRNKHESIVEGTREQVQLLNQKRKRQELRAKEEENFHIKIMESEAKELKKIANERRGGHLRSVDSVSRQNVGGPAEDTHPLLRRIENVMNRYTKLS